MASRVSSIVLNSCNAKKIPNSISKQVIPRFGFFNSKPSFICTQRNFSSAVHTNYYFPKKTSSNFLQIHKTINTRAYYSTDKGEEATPEVTPNVQEALDKISQRDINGAIEVLKKEIEVNDKSEKAYSLLAYCYQQQEDFDTAIDNYIQALNLNKLSPTLYNNIGVCFRKVERFNEALEAFEIASKIEPNQPSIYENKGVTYDYINDHEKAVECYTKAIELDPNNPNTYNNKAYSLFLLNRFEESLETYNKSIELSPSNALTLYYKGTVLEKLQRWEEAIESYNKSLEANPLSYLCQDSIGVCYLQLNQLEKALQAFTAAVQINPEFHVGIVNRAYTLRLLGRISESVELYLTVLPFFPSSKRLIDEVKKLQKDKLEQDASDLIEAFIKSRIMWETQTSQK